MPDTITAPAGLVRLVVDTRQAPRERMWGELIAPDRMRVFNVSLYCDISFGDVVPVERVCGCAYGDGVEHYVPTGTPVERGSRHVIAYTFGKSRRRMDAVADYVATWPTWDGSEYVRPAPGHVFCRLLECGHVAGACAQPRIDGGDIRWALALPHDTPDEIASEFLDELPYLAAHGLQPEDE